jgi:ABC-2 type transport system permease protein
MSAVTYWGSAHALGVTLAKRAVATRYAVSLVLGPPVVLWLLVQILDRVTGFAPWFPSGGYLAFVAPAFPAVAALPFAAGRGRQWLEDREGGMLEQFFAASLRPWLVVTAVLIGSCLVALAAAAAAIIAGILGGFRPAAGMQELPALVPVVLLLSMIYTAFSIAVALGSLAATTTATANACLLGLSILASNVLLPYRLLPGWIVTASTLSPVAYATDAARAALGAPQRWSTYWDDVGVLCGITLLITVAALILASARAPRAFLTTTPWSHRS